MPKAKEKSSTGLSIQLGDGLKYFTIGSKLSGDVVLNTAEDFAIGSVDLEFYGRVKVHYVQSHGQGESHWRGRAPLFSESLLLYKGFHTHKPGSFRWPFTFEIPTHPDPDSIKQSKHQWKEKEHFLSTEDYIPGHSIPATFAFRKLGWGFRWHVFVEYVLKVEVRQAEGSRVLLPPSSRKATLPILVKDVARKDSLFNSLPLSAQFSLPDQLTEKCRTNESQSHKPQLTKQIFIEALRSSRLIAQPETRRSSFSFREKTRQAFNSNSLPRYTFDISVSTPKTIQLLRKDSVPFVIGVSTITDAENTTIQPENYPDIRIDNVSVYLTAITYLRCKGPFSTKPTEYDIQLLERQPVDYTFYMKPEATLGGEEATTVSTSAQYLPPSHQHSIDISKLPNLSMSLIAAKMGKQIEKPLSPSFNTYIIAREYKLKWRLELDVAGEKIKVRNEEDIPVTVLPPEQGDLDVIMNEGDVSVTEVHEDDVEDVEGSEDGEDEMASGTSLGRLVKSAKRKSAKQREAEGEVEQGDAEEHSIRADANRYDDSMLPRYEQQPSLRSLAYRHEIDERPPTYEKD